MLRVCQVKAAKAVGNENRFAALAAFYPSFRQNEISVFQNPCRLQ